MNLRKAVFASCTAIAMTAGLAACGSDDSSDTAASTSAATSSSATTTEASASEAAPAAEGAPTAESLQSSLDFIADPTKSTAEKVAAVVNGEARTANIEQMNQALGGYGKLTFKVSDVKVEGDKATAGVTIESPSAPGQPTPPIPMTWQQVDGQWKLDDATTCTLLGFAMAPCAP